MTMAEMKPLAIAEFNLHISDTDAQQMFSDKFDLWGDEPCLYESTNNRYKAVIRQYATAISVEIERQKAVFDNEYTKVVKTNTSEMGKENDNTSRSANNKDTVDGKTNEIEFKTTQITYPDGYTGASDTAYLRAEGLESPFETTNHNDTTTTVNEKQVADKQSKKAGSVDIRETDYLAKTSQLLSYSSKINDLIGKCVFAFLGGKVITRFNRCGIWH